MVAPEAPRDRWPPIEYYRYSLVSVVAFVVAAACSVSAVFLATYSVPVTVNGNPVWVFPHWTAAAFFALGAAVFTVLGIVYGGIAWLCLDADRYREFRKAFR